MMKIFSGMLLDRRLILHENINIHNGCGFSGNQECVSGTQILLFSNYPVIISHFSYLAVPDFYIIPRNVPESNNSLSSLLIKGLLYKTALLLPEKRSWKKYNKSRMLAFLKIYIYNIYRYVTDLRICILQIKILRPP